MGEGHDAATDGTRHGSGEQRDRHDGWSAGASYEEYMGRWSRLVAARFVDWLDAPTRADWIEIGCGTGALTQAILARCNPTTLMATDASREFVTHAADTIEAAGDVRLRFEQAEAQDLPASHDSMDVAVCGLMLNFVPDRAAALGEMRRVLRPGGVAAFYVWDYPGGGMGFIDAFWRAAEACDPDAAELDEARRFPFCTRTALADECEAAGLSAVETASIEIETEFADLDAFWHPFTLGAGPAPRHCRSLAEDDRAALKRAVAREVDATGNAPIVLPARAWAVRATSH